MYFARFLYQTQFHYLQLSASIVNLPNLISRQQKMCEELKKAGKVTSEEEVIGLIEANNTFYNKLKISHNYKPSEKLKHTQVTLLRASGSSSKEDEDYGLRTLCQNVKTHLLEGTHETFFRGSGGKKALDIISPIFS